MDPVSKAQSDTGNSALSKPAYQRGLRPWAKGQSGNPSGRPKKNHITKIYEKILSKPVNRKEIEEAFKKVLTSGRMATVLMAREMAERTEGKIAQEMAVNVTGTIALSDTIQQRRKRRQSD